MHELAIAQSLVDAATREAERAGAGRVTRLVCRIGALHPIEGRLLCEAFAIAAADTICEAAEISIENGGLRAWCPHCHRNVSLRRLELLCPHCHGPGLRITGGDDLVLISIEAEDRPAAPRERGGCPIATGVRP